MGGGHGNYRVRESAAYRHGSQQQAFRHGGAGPVQPKVGYAGVPQGKGGADALVQQITGENHVKIRHSQTGFFRQLP